MIRRCEGTEITEELIKNCIAEHKRKIERLNLLDNYYNTKHSIRNRKNNHHYAPNNKLVHSFPKYITDTATGYMFGNPIMLQADKNIDITSLQEALKVADSNTHDAELGKDLSVFGIGYELIYMSGSEKPEPKIALLDPRNAFVVYDDTVEDKAIFGLHYIKSAEEKGFKIYVYTDDKILYYFTKSLSDLPKFLGEEEHHFGEVPIIQYWNNEEGMGDFEPVLSLIDAYDVLQSDRVNDKERFVNAILLIKNATLGDEEDSQIIEMLRGGILELPGTGDNKADAQYLTKTLNEEETEILKKAIAADIHKFSHTPDFTDEQFSGNTSGVAIKFKLLSLEYLAKVKERFFISGLMQRLKLFLNILHIKGYPKVETKDIEVIFNRTLPVNELENAQTLQVLNGIVSKETMLSQVSFVKDIQEEIRKLQNENDKKLETEKQIFNFPNHLDNVRL